MCGFAPIASVELLASQALAAVYFGLILISVVGLSLFLRVCWRRERDADGSEDVNWPCAAVIISLRGADPTLDRNLEGLCSLDYPDYEVVVMLDHERDPAADVVRRVLERFPDAPVRVEILRDPPETCSLKCAALAQALRTLDPTREVLAFADGDTIPYPTWLRELVRPFRDPTVDVATGYRWFVPVRWNVGTLVRYVWNAASYVHVYLNGVVWGGSFAVRRASAVRFGLRERWEKSLTEDIVVASAVRECGGRQVMAPAVLMACRESCSMPFAHRWCARQMLWVKMYGKHIWNRMMVLAVLLTVAHVATFVLLALAWSRGDGPTLAWTLGGLLFFWASALLFAILVEAAARHCIGAFQPPVRWRNPLAPLWLMGTLPFTLASFTLGLYQAYFVREVVWRGITYRVFKDGTARRLNYAPFGGPEPEPEPAPEQSGESIW